MIPTLLTLLLSIVPQGAKQGPEALTIGHFIEVRGTLDAQGRFVAEKLELQQPDDELLIGTVPADQTERDSFSLLGQHVELDPEVQWKGIEPGVLAGKRIQVTGDWKGPRKLIARTISARGPGRDRIGARIDGLTRVEGGWEARLLIFTVFLADGLELVHEQPLETYRLAKEHKVAEIGEKGTYERNEDELFGEGIALSDTLRLSGQAEARPAFEDNFDLDDGKDGDRKDYLFRFRTRFDWKPSKAVTGRLELRYDQLWREDERSGSISDQNGFLGETYLRWNDAFGTRGFDLTAGREKFSDPRRWIYHQNVDTLLATWDRPGWRLDLAAGTTVDDGSPRDKKAVDWIAYLSNNDRKEHLATWAIYRNIGQYPASSTLLVNEQDLHFGVRAVGEFFPRNDSWFDVAYELGSRTQNGTGVDISAWAYDAGTTWYPSFAEPLYLTLGYALASGGSANATNDESFRQTGFQDNKGKFGGVSSFKYYGELIDPELTNLGILTLGLGVLVAEKVSLDLVYHTYTQDVARKELSFPPVDSSLKRATLSGLDADIGAELDLIFGYRRFASWDLEVVAAHFESGDAFTIGDDADLLKVQLRYRF